MASNSTSTINQTSAPTLAQFIETSGKSLAQIARESDLSLSHVSRLRSHNRLPSVTTAAKLAVVLDVPLGDLIRAATAINRPTRQRPSTDARRATDRRGPQPLPTIARRVMQECLKAA